FKKDAGIETFYFVLSGSGELIDEPGDRYELKTGAFGLTVPGREMTFAAGELLRLVLLRKVYQEAPRIELFRHLHGHESEVPAEVWMQNPASRLQTLIPDDLQYDLAMNIFTFDPGHGLPYVETHVMEHGLLFLEGKGVYYLDGEWIEVEKDDFIWMGPYCPQSFYATGPTPAKYLYYKNVNREIRSEEH